LTRAKVFQLGLLILALGAIGYGGFRLLGFDDLPAGIAAESLLVILLVGWIGSYLLRVFTGNMTFMEQRRRYRKAYEDLTDGQIQERLDAMSEEDRQQLLEDIESENESL